MPSATIATVVSMMETLPEAAQEELLRHLRKYVADLQDELHWDAAFARTQDQLAAAARRAREEVAAGLAKPLDPDQL